jgi:hypothetical protein
MKFILASLIVLSCMCSSLIAQRPSFSPTHELEKDTSLTAFISRLKKAIDKKDVEYIISVLDKQVAGGFESEGGVDEFVEMWTLRSDSTYFWGYIKRAIELSGAYVNDPNDETGRYKVVYPYTYNYEPDLEDDYFSLGLITGKNVNLRERPDTKAPVKTQLTYEPVWFLYGDRSGFIQSGTNESGEPEWYQVESYDHAHKGWVFWKYVYPAVGPRLFLYKDQRGKWLISAFVAGD